MRYLVAWGFLITAPLEASYQIYQRGELKSIVLAMEEEHNIPRHLLDAIILQESNYHVTATNSASNPGVKTTSFGLGQLTLATARSHCQLSRQQVYHPVANIECAAKVLKWQLRRYNGHIGRAVAAYQWGTPCECNGQVYTQRFLSRTRVCFKRGFNGRKIPLMCRKTGKFWNQWYVDSVLKKRVKARGKGFLMDICLKLEPCNETIEYFKGLYYNPFAATSKLNNFNVSFLDKLFQVRVTDRLGSNPTLRKKIDDTTVAKDNIFNIFVLKVDDHFSGNLLANQNLLYG